MTTDETGHGLKLQLVWASVFLMACAAYGFTTIMAYGPGSEAGPMCGAIALGMLLSIFTVPFLLMFAGNGRGLMLIGRLLVGSQMLCLVGAVALSIMMMVG